MSPSVSNSSEHRWIETNRSMPSEAPSKLEHGQPSRNTCTRFLNVRPTPRRFFEPTRSHTKVHLGQLLSICSCRFKSDVADIVGHKHVKRSNEVLPVRMKPKEHDELYDSCIKQTVLRTLHEVFESIYTPHVEATVVNGWIHDIDPATGHSRSTCVISVHAQREAFQTINLSNVDPNECIKSLKGVVAGPLSSRAPVRPIMKLDRTDARCVASKDVLDSIDASMNLAEIPWEDFEQLVRELFGKLFWTDGAEVRVTQASRDGGVDAVAFDPDPIRGGKFVIQAKRYTKVVPVSAVRDLYGTMINEGAAKGILVTTAHFGPDTREFVKNKPITLIDGSNLVYLLEQHGHRVRIDIEAARRARTR
jgi:restriction system protein